MNDPSATYASIRRMRQQHAGSIAELKVGDTVYPNESVQDGFYAAIRQLKLKKPDLYKPGQSDDYLDDYRHIIDLCMSTESVPPIPENVAFDILAKMKSSVRDVFSITPLHYINAGLAGFKHVHILLNVLLSDVQNTMITDVNLAYAVVLFKGHGKDRSSAKSYRTISTCPVVAKGLDLYLRTLSLDYWNEDQSSVQFQGEGSSHELAGLLLTECIQYAHFALKKPLYVLYLDARSAFDVVQRELLIRNLYNVQSGSQLLVHIDNRLAHRRTVVDWNGNLMGPISDEQGLEQGGINSSDYYKIYGKEILTLPQLSQLGLKIGPLCVSSIGQADDTLLLATDITSLFYLLELVKSSCKKNMIDLSAEKTILQLYSKVPPDQNEFNPLKIDGKSIPFSSRAVHVGIVRSIDGNESAILDRITAHRKALASILFTGLAKGHRANPMIGLRVENIYAKPVLLSGIAALVLTKRDIDMIDHHYQETLRQLLRLHRKTPRSVIYFLAGSLPGAALVHMRQLNLFSMISRLDSRNLLYLHAQNFFSSLVQFRGSWFHQIREWCLMYQLPHPSELFSQPLTKDSFKIMVKKHVVSYWEYVLRHEAFQLKSLSLFRP